MIKISGTEMDDFTKSGNLKDFHLVFSDLDRYRSDKYELDLTMRETKLGYSMSCVAFHSHIGIICFTRYWHYKKGEVDVANKTFDSIRKIAVVIRDEFEYDKVPPVLIGNRLANSLIDVDLDHREATYVPAVNYSRKEFYEKDIRKSLYGDRYPEAEVENYREVIQEQSKQVITEKTGRSKVVKYKKQF